MPSVLLIEDDPGQRKLVERMLGPAYAVTWCADRQTALTQLMAGDHDVWLIDYYLADGDGLDLLATARRHDPHTAAILLTGAADPLVDRRALELGAAARLDKDGLTPERLGRAIDFAMHQARLLGRFAERDEARQGPAADPDRLVRFARAERAVRAALSHDGIGLDRGLFFGRLLHAGLDLTGCHSGIFATLEHDCVIPEALVGLPADATTDERPFEPDPDSLLGRALQTAGPILADGQSPSGMGEWVPAAGVVLPIIAGGRIAAVIVLACTTGPTADGRAPDQRLATDLLDIYVELCAGALERHLVDERRRRAEADLESCDRLLRAVTGMAQRLPALDDEASALALAARCLGRAGEAQRVFIVQRSPAGDWHRRMEWIADDQPPVDDARETVRLTERMALDFDHRPLDPWPRALPMMPGRPSLIRVPILVHGVERDAPGAMVTADGAVLWGAVAIVGSPLDVRGMARGILRSAAQGIAGQLARLDALRRMRRAQSERDERSRRLRALVERSGDLLLVLDEEGRVTWHSPAVAEHLGWPTDPPAPLPFDTRMHPDDRARWQALLASVDAAPGEAVRAELRLRGAAGDWRVLDATLCNALDDGLVGGLIVNARDITAQRRLWAHFLRSRTVESLDRLATALAHELNNLLTVILTSAAIATDVLPTAHPASPDLDAITDAAQSGARLAHRLLQFTGAQPATLRPVTVAETLEAARPLVESVASDVRFAIEPAPGVGRLLADVDQLVQVLLVLTLNARDAIEPGRDDGRISLSAREASGPVMRGGHPLPDEERAYVVLTVTDDGRGMSAETQRRIFEPFFTTKRHMRGAGMGLATVFGIVRRHSGRLTVESAPGHGSAFHVWIPRAPDPA